MISNYKKTTGLGINKIIASYGLLQNENVILRKKPMTVSNSLAIWTTRFGIGTIHYSEF